MMEQQRQSSGNGPSIPGHINRSYGLVAFIAALSLIFGGFLFAVPGQAEEGSDVSGTSVVSSEPSEPAASPSGEEASPEASSSPSSDPSATESPEPSASPEPSPSSSASPTATEQLQAMAQQGGASLSVGKSSYLAGELVDVEGHGWGKTKSISTQLLDPNGSVLAEAEITSGQDGTFSASLQLPTDSFGLHTIRAWTNKPDREQTVTFDVLALEKPTIAAEPGGQSSSAKISGTGWTPDKKVRIVLDDREGNPWVWDSSSEVGADGTFNVSIPLPAEYIPIFDVVAEGDATGRTATTTFTDSASSILTMRKSGSRISDTSASTLDGAVFDVYDMNTSTSTTIPSGESPAYTCTTGQGSAPDGNPNASGECSVRATWASGTSHRFLVVERSAPSDWDVLPEFATDSSGSDPYRFNVQLTNGQTKIVPDTGTSSSQQWANRLTNPSWPGFCGMNVALLFDESTSISSTEWGQMKDAAANLVLALEGTPSKVAQFSFSTTALSGKYVPLTSVQSSTDANALADEIRAKKQQGGYTNWDEGLYQIAQTSEAYDAVLVLTDGDPTVYGTETSGNVRIVTVQEAVHSANAVKSEGARIVGVGIGLSSTSAKNLAAISGPTSGDDYYLPANFTELDQALKDIATSQCGGTVVIEKQLGSRIPGSTGTDSNGWPFTAEVTANGANTSTIATPTSEKTGVLNDQNGQLQYKFVGGEWPKSVRITELANPDAPGYSLEDVQCTRGTTRAPIIASEGYVDIPDVAIDETVSCIFLNSQDTGSLTVVKELTNAEGASVPATFGIDYECKIDDAVTASGSVNVAPGAAGEVVTGIPTGSTCTITEDALTPIPGYTWQTVTYDPRSVDVTSTGGKFTVTAQNSITKNAGSLQLVKTLTGGPNEYTGQFSINYECTKTGDKTITGERSITAGSSAVISGLPEGYECLVSEPITPTPPTGYTFATPTFDPSNTTTILNNQTVTITTRNTLTRDTGSLRIVKDLTGTPDTYNPTFTVSYLCTLDGEQDINGAVEVLKGETVDVSGTVIPTGYTCTVTEGALPDLPAGYEWNEPSYSNNQDTTPGNVVVINSGVGLDQDLPADQVATVSVNNSATASAVPVTPTSATPPPGAQQTGALTVTKILNGAPDGFAAAFQIAYTCSGAGGSVSSVLSLGAGESATVFGIPNGSSCSVSENDLPPAPAGFNWAPPKVSGSPTPGISGGATASVTVTNALVSDQVSVPVEPASPILPASPDGGVDVGPAGVPVSVPAGAGNWTDAPTLIWVYLAIVTLVAGTVGGTAYATRSRRQ